MTQLYIITLLQFKIEPGHVDCCLLLITQKVRELFQKRREILIAACLDLIVKVPQIYDTTCFVFNEMGPSRISTCANGLSPR
jgi:hypothetical protein